MGRNDSEMLPSFLKFVLVALLVMGTAIAPVRAANDLPLAAGSPLAGFAFDDRPLALSVQRNFQMAMLTASSELGRSCGKTEAYGWRMDQSEQRRVNQIFNSTVDRMRGLGYVVESQAPTSVSRDITMFTADRPDKHFIIMWSAGEIGLVMVLCESSAPLNTRTAVTSPSVQVFPQAAEVMQSPLANPAQDKARKATIAKFSPVGDWVGHYTCEQGYTGGTLQIAHLNGENFDGYFRFYPSPKNPYVPTGRYTVYGQYDRESQRILINPGEWLERPKDFYNTIMVGSFDPVARTFSAYFQGIMGCTSFEAKYAGEDYEGISAKPVHKAVKKKPKKKTPAAKPLAKPPVPATKPVESQAPLQLPVIIEAPPVVVAPATGNNISGVTPAAPTTVVPASAPTIVAPAPTAPVSAPAVVAPVSPPVATAPADAAPAIIILPAPETPTVPSALPPIAPAPQSPATSAPVPLIMPAAPSAPTIESTPVMPLTPTSTPLMPSPSSAPGVQPVTTPLPTPPPDSTAPKPTGSLNSQPGNTVVASSGTWFTPTIQQAPPPTYVTPRGTYVPSTNTVQPVVVAPPPNYITPSAPQVLPTPTVPDVMPAPLPTTTQSTVPQAPEIQTVPPPTYITPYVQQVPPAQMVPDTGGPHP